MAVTPRKGTIGSVAPGVDGTVIMLDTAGPMAPDVITEETIVTTGFFDGKGTISSSTANHIGIYTASISDTNEKYYIGIGNRHQKSSSLGINTYFHGAFGHYAGSGSETGTDNDTIGTTEVIYKSFSELLLPETEVTGGLIISSPASDSAVTSGKDEYVYILSAERKFMKDKIDPGNWTVMFTGSESDGTQAVPKELHLTDDSKDVAAVNTLVGPRHNIVSGTNGTVVSASTARCFGWIYPDMGIMVFSGAELSRSIQGTSGNTNAVAFNSGSQLGFGPTLNDDLEEYNHIRLINCLGAENNGKNGYIKMRSAEVQQSTSYFVRLKAPYMNFTNNPTFVSESENRIRHKSMRGNPQVYVTTVGLYNENFTCVGVARLSKPVLKNFQSEVSLKVKLKY